MINTLWQRGRALWLRRSWRRPLLLSTILVSIGILLVGLIRGWDTLLRSDWHFDWAPLLLSSLSYAVSLAFAMLGWSVIMQALRVQATWRQNAKFYLYAWMARRLPTPAPYLTSRVLLYEEVGVPKRLTSVGLIWENVLLIAASALLVVLMLPLSPLINDAIPEIGVLVAVALSMLFVVHPSLLTRMVNWALRRLGKPAIEVELRSSATALALALYAGVWLTGGLLLFFLIRTMYPLEWAKLPFIIQCWSLSGLVAYVVFFAPVSFGVREITLATSLSLVVPLPVAIVVVLLARIWNMMNELLWAFIVYKL
jgi:glycosyltransferase 2 family protein